MLADSMVASCSVSDDDPGTSGSWTEPIGPRPRGPRSRQAAHHVNSIAKRTRTADAALVQGGTAVIGAECPGTSANVVRAHRPSAGPVCGQTKTASGWRAGSSATLNDALLLSISRHQHISLSKQQAAARSSSGPQFLEPAAPDPASRTEPRYPLAHGRQRPDLTPPPRSVHSDCAGSGSWSVWQP